jgi:glyoxylate reductase
MRLLYTSRSPKPEVDQDLGGQRVELEQLLAESDFISIHTDLNADTREMFGEQALDRMKRDAVLVNTARGGVIDQPALVEALRRGTIRAAGLDVTTPEPLPPDHPLVGLPNCFVLPHIGSATDHSRAAMAEIAADNVIAGLQDKPLRCAVA